MYIIIIITVGFVIEWDPINLCSINTADALGSPIWSFDADCTLDRLAAGTDDGKVLETYTILLTMCQY